MKAALAGALALAAAIGIGRFAFTALLPATQLGLRFDDATAGAIASANLVGYLLGAIAGRAVAAARVRPLAVRAALVAVVASTALLAVTTSWWGWSALRFVAGAAGGVVFVAVSAAALEPRAGEAPRPGVLYSGVGVGMAITGATAAIVPVSSWRAGWLVVAAIAAALSVLPWVAIAAPPPRAGRHPPADAPAPAVLASTAPQPFSLGRLALAYFLEAVGYIVSGTFTVLAVRRTPGLAQLAPWAWTLAGLAAAPSALLWSALGRRAGLRAALVTAHLAQAGGMALPALSPSALAAAVGALFFGGTFMGIATLTMSAARAIAPRDLARTVGSLTAVYGVGQIAGPALAGVISHRTGSPGPAVLAAAAAVAVGGAVLVPRRGPRGSDG
jgi:predicted MFS family arabinose efflux permease